MRSNYLPATPTSLSRFPVATPDFAYGEAFLGNTAPFLSGAAPRRLHALIRREGVRANYKRIWLSETHPR